MARAVNDMTVGAAAKDFKGWCLGSDNNIRAWLWTAEANGLLEKSVSLHSKAHFFPPCLFPNKSFVMSYQQLRTRWLGESMLAFLHRSVFFLSRWHVTAFYISVL